MPRSPWSRTIALLILFSIVSAPLVLGQEGAQTRPRRAQSSSQTSAAEAIQPASTRLANEPTIRIGLATNARAVIVSTTGRLMRATENDGVAPEPLAVARVRVEPRMLAPSQVSEFCVEIAGAATRVDADRAARQIQQQINESAEVIFDAATNTYRVRIGRNLSAAQAEELRARLEDAGFATAAVVDARSAASSSARSSMPATRTGAGNVANSPSLVRPVSRASSPSRAAVVYAGGSSILTSHAPVIFASDDERNAPVRFNEKPYRGRLEVFANAHGSLTVVNVLGLEDYVRGVVPNELSPGSFPAIEALKAQAVAARTYAVKNRNQFASQGFDLLPTTRSQVYGGLSTEQPLSTRAVEETRGIVATYKGAAINALYTSTCGGRTENSENIFTAAEPYLRGRECSIEGRAHFSPFTIKTSRETADIREDAHLALARDIALLSVNGLSLTSARITDQWLATGVSASEVRNWMATVARLARVPAPLISDDATKAPAFASALAATIYGEGRADTLLSDADVEYILSFRDADDIPPRHRADVALLVRDGFLPLYADATLRPREPMTRARMLRTIVALMEARGKLSLQRGTTRPATGGALVLRSTTKNRDISLVAASDAYLFRAFGATAYQMRSLVLMGGEAVVFHLNARGEVDYMEVRPSPDGATAERFSPFTNWTTELSLGEAQARLARWARGVGSLVDLRIAARGASRRATDLELVGTNGTGHVRGGRIRSALGLREQLFVVERRYDDAGRVTGFIFTGRGWGHGVGLCQVGASGMARAGLSYEKILKAYYTGIELTKLY